MVLDEITQTRLIVGLIAIGFLLLWALSKLVERRRRRWVDSLAMAFAATAAHGSDATSQFELNVDCRRCDIAHGYRARTMDGRYIRGVNLVVTVRLRNVPDIYNLSFRRRGHERTSDSLIVKDSGYHPPENWITEGLSRAIFDFYDFVRDRAPLSLEGGTLMYTTSRRLSGESLRTLLELQIAVAANIEAAL